MKKKSLISVGMVAVMGFASPAFAYNAGNVETKCKDPHFKTFTPPHKAEVASESEISFTVSGYADPTTIKAIARNIPLKLDIIDRGSFYAVSAKLPAALAGKYARIHVKAHNSPECKGKDGWLIKIKKDTEGG